MDISNPFIIEDVATRYHKHRPQYHKIPFSMIGQFVGRTFHSSLDVACGTGHSTTALADFSKNVIGCDSSDTMIARARKNSNMTFVKACAENLPFRDKTFDFLNISMGFHWVEQEMFLQEGRRVLEAKGHLSVDNYRFLGQISNDLEKQKLHTEFLREHLPPASRRSGYPTEKQVALAGFKLIKEFKFEHHLDLSFEGFTNIIMTWSNFQVLSDGQKRQVSHKMKDVYEKIFEGQSLSLGFGGRTLLYQAI